jgi:pimeloyl-ACP methyl ester carboxylesterase
MAGEFDIIKPEHTAELSRAIPNSQKIIIQGATHSVPTDKPDDVNKLISKFLEGD